MWVAALLCRIYRREYSDGSEFDGFLPSLDYTAGTKFEIGSQRLLPCVTGVCARRCHVLAMRLVQSSCRLAGRFFKYSGPSRSGTCPVPDGIAGWRAACAGYPLHGSRSCPAGKAVKNPGSSSVPAAAAPDGCCQHCFWQPEGTGGGVEPPLACAGAAKRLRTGRAWRYAWDSAIRLVPLHLPLDEIPIYSPVLGAAVQHLPDPF